MVGTGGVGFPHRQGSIDKARGCELGGVAPLPRVANQVRPSLSRTTKTKFNALGYYGQSVDSLEVYLNTH